MSDNCEYDCGSCQEDCESRKTAAPDLKARLHQESTVKRTLCVVSGKGGVGKSMATAMLAVALNRRQHRVAIMDADITGPSIPKMFGLQEKAQGSDLGIFPVTTKTGIDVMSINLLLENVTDPVVWRGALISTAVKQFWTDVIWRDTDYMLIDMPPGTGDVALTVFQSLPLDGIIIVTSPQELVSLIVEKAVRMAELMQIPVLGLIENFSYFKCPDNGKEYQIFGDSHIDEIAERYQIPILARVPIDPRIAAASDRGMVELFEADWFDQAAQTIESELPVTD